VDDSDEARVELQKKTRRRKIKNIIEKSRLKFILLPLLCLFMFALRCIGEIVNILLVNKIVNILLYLQYCIQRLENPTQGSILWNL